MLRHPHGVGRGEADGVGGVVAAAALAHGDDPQPEQPGEHGDLHRHVHHRGGAAEALHHVGQGEARAGARRRRTGRGGTGRRWGRR